MLFFLLLHLEKKFSSFSTQLSFFLLVFMLTVPNSVRFLPYVSIRFQNNENSNIIIPLMIFVFFVVATLFIAKIVTFIALQASSSLPFMSKLNVRKMSTLPS